MATARKPVKPVKPAAKAVKSAPSVKSAPKPAVALASEDAASVVVTPVEIFDAAAAKVEDMREFGRTFALQSVEGVRAAYDRSRLASEEVAGSVEKVYSKMTEGFRTLQTKAIENMQANTLAFFEMSKRLATAPSPTDALSMGSEQCRKQMEALNGQAKEFAALAKKVTEDAMAPVTSTLGKNFGLRA